MADENNVKIEQILIEIQAYVEKLNQTLKTSIPKEIRLFNKDCREIIMLAGELDDYLTKR